MPFSSQGGHVILRTQTVQGTYNADTGTAGAPMKLRTGALGTTRTLMVPDAEIGGGRDVVDSYLGPVVWAGSYEFYARMEALTTLLKACLGSEAIVTTTGVSTHTITPLDSATLPYLSIEEQIGGSSGLEVYNYTDAVVDSLHLEAAADGYLMGTAGIMAAKQIAGATPTGSLTYDETPMTVGTNITLTYNAVTVPAKSFSLDINNQFDDSSYKLGSFYVTDLTAKRREIKAGFVIRESSSALWRQACYGVSSATAPGGLTTKNQLIITMTTYESIPGGTPTTSYSMTITIPKFILDPYSFAASNDTIIDSTLAGQAVRPAFATPILTAVVVNGKTTTA